MAEPKTFRSALNGFNREDVVNYISYITSKHETQTNQLRAEADSLREEISQLRAQGSQMEELEAQLQAQQAENVRLQEKVEALLAQQAAPFAEEEKKPESTGWNEELNAYRRAESAERRAMERVNQMYDKASGALADASVRLEENAVHLSGLAAAVQKDLDALQEALVESRATMANTAVVLGAIRPADN